MKLEGTFTFISMEERTRDGKTYYNANIESVDGSLLRVGTNEDVAKTVKKYSQHRGYFTVGSYNNSMYMRLDAVELLENKK